MKTGRAVFRKEAENTRRYAAEELQCPALDFNREGVELIEKILTSSAMKSRPKEEIPALIFSFGCFFGEVLIREFKGKWIPASKLFDSKIYIPLTARTGYEVDVFTLVASRIEKKGPSLMHRIEEISGEIEKASKILPHSLSKSKKQG